MELCFSREKEEEKKGVKKPTSSWSMDVSLHLNYENTSIACLFSSSSSFAGAPYYRTLPSPLRQHVCMYIIALPFYYYRFFFKNLYTSSLYFPPLKNTRTTRSAGWMETKRRPTAVALITPYNSCSLDCRASGVDPYLNKSRAAHRLPLAAWNILVPEAKLGCLDLNYSCRGKLFPVRCMQALWKVLFFFLGSQAFTFSSLSKVASDAG